MPILELDIANHALLTPEGVRTVMQYVDRAEARADAALGADDKPRVLRPHCLGAVS